MTNCFSKDPKRFVTIKIGDYLIPGTLLKSTFNSEMILGQRKSVDFCSVGFATFLTEPQILMTGY